MIKSNEELQRILQHREEYRKNQRREYDRNYYRKKHPLKEKEIKKCSFCGKEEHHAKGLCNNCYYRYRRNGKVEYVREFLTEEERIIRKRENNRIRCKRYRHRHIEQERERSKKYYRTHKEEIKMRRLKKRGGNNDK